MDFLNQKEIAIEKILWMQHDYLIESNILFWYRESKFSVWNDYPLDSKRNFLLRENDFSRTKSNNLILNPISFSNWFLINIAPNQNTFLMEMIWFCYKRIFFLKVGKFRYLLTKFLVQNDFLFGARGNGSIVCFFFCDSLSEARVVMWLRHWLPNPKVGSSIPGDCTSELTSYNFFSLVLSQF